MKFIEAHNQLKKNNIKEIRKNHNNSSINNLFLNKKQIDILKNNLFGENLKNKKDKKDIIKAAIKKILGKEKNRKLLEKDEKLRNLVSKCGLYTKEKLKKQKFNSKKGAITKKNKVNNNIGNSSNNKLYMTQNKSWKSKSNKILNEDNKKKK